MPGNPTTRVIIPKRADESLKLAASVYAKHQADGKDSPLNALEEWETVGPKVARASAAQTEIEKLEKQLEKLYEARDNLLPDIVDLTRRSRGLLAAIFKKSPRTLGDWGYTVDDSPRPAARKKKAPGA